MCKNSFWGDKCASAENCDVGELLLRRKFGTNKLFLVFKSVGKLKF
jgi:hypothetical protein